MFGPLYKKLTGVRILPKICFLTKIYFFTKKLFFSPYFSKEIFKKLFLVKKKTFLAKHNFLMKKYCLGRKEIFCEKKNFLAKKLFFRNHIWILNPRPRKPKGEKADPYNSGRKDHGKKPSFPFLPPISNSLLFLEDNIVLFGANYREPLKTSNRHG